MSETISPKGQKIWIRAGWGSLLLGWLGYFALMAFTTRSPSMHTYAAYLAMVFGMMALTFAILGWRKGEGGHVALLMTLLATPIIWYFFAVLAMAIIAYTA